MTGRAFRFAVASALLAAVGPVASAQAVRPLVNPPQPHAAPDLVARSHIARLATRPEAGGAAAAKRRVFATSASVAGGAVLGSFLGYFMSQVVKSDWEGERTGDRAAHRRRFTISGAAVGAIGGYLIRPRGGRARPEPPGFYIYVAPSERHYITHQELRRAIVLSALEAVQLLRPEWLSPSQLGPQSTGNGSPPVGTETAIAVYVVNRRIGGPEALADISIPEVEELRLYEPREAARRWGTAHPHGAIEIVPAATRTAK